MNVTEVEATDKWCPFSMVVAMNKINNGSVTSTPTHQTAYNRGMNILNGEVIINKGATCIAKGCMLFKQSKQKRMKDDGSTEDVYFCGMSNKE